MIFAGYQAEGTIGRSLVDGSREVRLFGETIEVEAHIETLHDISGHADRDGLLKWAEAFKKKPQQFFIVHGSDDVCDRFARLVTEHTGVAAKAPVSGAEFDLLSGRPDAHKGGGEEGRRCICETACGRREDYVRHSEE